MLIVDEGCDEEKDLNILKIFKIEFVLKISIFWWNRGQGAGAQVSAWPLWLKRGEEGEIQRKDFWTKCCCISGEKCCLSRENLFQEEKNKNVYFFRRWEESVKAHQLYFTRSHDQNIPKYGHSVAQYSKVWKQCGTNCHNISKYGHNVAQIVTIFQSMETMWHKLWQYFKVWTQCSKVWSHYSKVWIHCGKVWTHCGTILQRRRAEKVNPVDDKFKVEGPRKDREWIISHNISICFIFFTSIQYWSSYDISPPVIALIQCRVWLL